MTLQVGVLSVGLDGPYLDYARAAERLGASSIWTAEFWGNDAFTPLAAIANVTERIQLGTAIAQLGARTPAMLAMRAMGLQAISDGRFLLGIGATGPDSAGVAIRSAGRRRSGAGRDWFAKSEDCSRLGAVRGV